MSRPSQRRWSLRCTLGLVLGGALLLALAGAGCASSDPRLPDFPKYEAADDFLAMQARLKNSRPPPPSPDYAYTDRNEAIYQALQQQQQASQSDLEFRARQRDEALRRNRAATQGEWDAMRQRLARDEAMDALREQERAQNGLRNQQVYQERYDIYRSRLERLAQEQEAVVRAREQAAFENQLRVGAQVEELKRRQSQNLRVQGFTATGETAPPGQTPAAPPQP